MVQESKEKRLSRVENHSFTHEDIDWLVASVRTLERRVDNLLTIQSSDSAWARESLIQTRRSSFESGRRCGLQEGVSLAQASAISRSRMIQILEERTRTSMELVPAVNADITAERKV